MFFSPRLSTRHLAQLCRRVATALAAGVDLRRIWTAESEMGPSRQRPAIQQIAARVKAGDSLADALRSTHGAVPPLMCELVDVGEQAGRLDAVFRQLAEHWEHALALRREFTAAITWPLAQLGMAIGLLGVLIWVMGLIEQFTGTRVDILGFGLVGNAGLAIYCGIICAALAAVLLPLYLSRRSRRVHEWMQAAIAYLPGFGKANREQALSRFCWAMSAALEAGMSVGPAVETGLRSARQASWWKHNPAMQRALAHRDSLYNALAAAPIWPQELLDSIAAAELTGLVAEELQRQSDEANQRARAASQFATRLAAGAVWLLVTIVLIVLIFRLFSFYVGTWYRAMPK